MSYKAGLNYFGADSVFFEVSDLGNTGTGGAKIASKLLALNITPVNDAPVPTGSLSTGLLVGGSVTLNPSMIGTTDVDNLLTALTFRVTQTPANGFLERVGSPGINVVSFTTADIASGAIRYVHNGITAGLDEFQFDVFDGAINSSVNKFELLVAAPTVPPQLNPTSNSAISYAEQAAPVLLAPNVSITVVDSLRLLGATVRISSGGDLLTDRLIFVDQNNIRGSIDAFGVLTLSGVDTPQNYQNAIRSVQFESTSDTPSVAIRTIEFSVDDGFNSSNISRVQLNILSVNDAPDVSTSIGARTLEDVVYSNANFTSILVSDVDTPSSALLQVTLSSTQGVITLRTLAGISFLPGSTANGAAMTFTGTIADVNAALADFQFLGLNNFNGVAQVNVAVTDSGDANGSNKLTRMGVLQITVDPVNDAPVLLNPTIGNAVFSEGGANVAVIPALSLTDIDSALLSSAKVTIGAGYIPAQDRLIIANSQGLSVSWDNATGTLSIIGDASSAVYESVLRSVSYKNISQSVTVGFRTITFSVSDPALESGALSRVVEVTPVNDPPVLDIGAITNFTENSAAVVVAPSLSISDIDSEFLSGARWTISGSYLAGSDVLQFTNTALITGVWDAANATLTLTGTATVFDYESALRQVTFLTSTDNPIAVSRDFTLQVTDSGGSQVVTVLTGFAVNAVNDAPVVSLAANIAATEDISLAIFPNTGAAVLKDVDANQQTLTFTIDVNRGTLQLPAGNNVVSAQGSGTAQLTVVGTLLQLTTLLGQVTYSPEANFNGSIQLQITLQDQFGLRDLKSAQIQIAAVNDAPTLTTTNAALAVVNSGSANDLFSNAVLRDVDSPLLDSAVVKIAANYAVGDRISVTSIAKVTSAWDPSTGTLTLTGAASASEYESILQTLQFSTTSLSLNERSISLALKDAGGASAAVSRNVTVSSSVVDPKTTTPTPNKNVPTTTDTGIPPITSTTNAAPTAQNSAGASSAPVASTTGQQGAVTSGTRLGGTSSSGTFTEKDSAGSGQSEDSVFTRERANRIGGAVVRVGSQSLNSLEAVIVKGTASAVTAGREGDSDLRGVLSSARIAETRGVDIGARLLQIANRDSAQVASSAALLLTVAGTDVDDQVNIKVSKADQLAVDLLALPVQSGGVVISAAVLWWITRAGGLLTALLTSLPSWQHFDPLPILTSTDGRPEDDWGEENEEDDRELDAVLNQ
jgi:Cadherin-like/Bacterial Ig domain